MPTTLRITSRLHITPLLDMHHPPFEKLYRDGVYWSLFKDRCTKPLSDRYLLENIRATLNETDVDGQHAYCLPTIGFHVGRLHGVILSPQTGHVRQGVTALVSFTHKNTARGYHVGREFYFLDAEPDERLFTNEKLIERLQETERDSVEFSSEEGTWYYTLGCLLGEMSGQLFPATSEEYARWEAQNRKLLAEYEQERGQQVETEPVDPLPIGEYTV
jgi:hypothetical protein